MTEQTTEAAVILGAALASAEPKKLDGGNQYVVTVPAGYRAEHIDLDTDYYRKWPRRHQGTVHVTDVDSFKAYFDKHADDSSEVYAKQPAGSITAVLDAHTEEYPRWCEHRVVLGLKYSQPWAEWNLTDGKPMKQLAFAEFIEDHLADVRQPAAAELLELAQTFQATTKVTFKSGTILASGQKQLTYEEQTDAQAGNKGRLTIPHSIKLGLEVYEDSGVADAVTARLRYRINGGELYLSYHLDRPKDVERTAFAAIVARVGEALHNHPILRGTPA